MKVYPVHLSFAPDAQGNAARLFWEEVAFTVKIICDRERERNR